MVCISMYTRAIFASESRDTNPNPSIFYSVQARAYPLQNFADYKCTHLSLMGQCN
jgi:hypothetical protein